MKNYSIFVHEGSKGIKPPQNVLQIQCHFQQKFQDVLLDVTGRYLNICGIAKDEDGWLLLTIMRRLRGPFTRQ